MRMDVQQRSMCAAETAMHLPVGAGLQLRSHEIRSVEFGLPRDDTRFATHVWGSWLATVRAPGAGQLASIRLQAVTSASGSAWKENSRARMQVSSRVVAVTLQIGAIASGRHAFASANASI